MAGAVKEIMQQHHYPPVTYTALTQCLATSTLLITRLKFNGVLTLQLESGGTINLLVTKCNEKLEARGMARWEDIADQQQLTVDFYSGRLVVTISPDNSSSQYQSIVDLGSGSLSKALEDYLLQFELLSTVLLP
jgi:molecular chaperone Hsp33